MSAPVVRPALEWHDANGIPVVRFTTRSLRDDGLIRSVFEQIDGLLKEAGGGRVVLNFAGVDSFASFSIGKLVGLNGRLRAEGRLALCCLTPTASEILDIMRLRKQFHVYATEQEAVDSFA